MEITLELLQEIIRQLPNYIFVKDNRLVYRLCNQNFTQMVGRDDPMDIIGKSDDEMPWGPYTAHIYQQEDRQILTTGLSISNKEVPMILPGKGEHILSVSKAPLYDPNRNIIGILGIYIDITEQKTAEKNEKAALEQAARADAKAQWSKVLAASIAHELRTPLATIDTLASNLSEVMPSLIEGYQKAISQALGVKPLKQAQIPVAENSLEILKQVTKAANTFVEMMLLKVNLDKVGATELILLSIKQCVIDALNLYPLTNSEKILIKFNDADDFMFKGDSTLIRHVLFNLFKNALHYVKAANKGDIQIWFEQGTDFNILHFKDTGKGIAADVLPHIFKQFYSNTRHGTGVGLALCKIIMEEFDGNITCDSKEDEYVHFRLCFPKL